MGGPGAGVRRTPWAEDLITTSKGQLNIADIAVHLILARCFVNTMFHVRGQNRTGTLNPTWIHSWKILGPFYLFDAKSLCGLAPAYNANHMPADSLGFTWVYLPVVARFAWPRVDCTT